MSKFGVAMDYQINCRRIIHAPTRLRVSLLTQQKACPREDHVLATRCQISKYRVSLLYSGILQCQLDRTAELPVTTDFYSQVWLLFSKLECPEWRGPELSLVDSLPILSMKSCCADRKTLTGSFAFQWNSWSSLSIPWLASLLKNFLRNSSGIGIKDSRWYTTWISCLHDHCVWPPHVLCKTRGMLVRIWFRVVPNAKKASWLHPAPSEMPKWTFWGLSLSVKALKRSP